MAEDAKVTCDGKDEDLKASMPVQVTTHNDDKTVAPSKVAASFAEARTLGTPIVIEIRRDGVLLQTAQISGSQLVSGSLNVRAERDGARVLFQLNQYLSSPAV